MMKIAATIDIEPWLTRLPNWPSAFGRPAAMPAKIRIEMPLPRPRSVICSPSHIRNIVPATRLTTAVRRKPKPGAMTRPGEPSSASAMPSDWNSARPSVP